MNKKLGILASFFIALSLMLGSVNEAQAKRLGGGSSFGSRPSYSQPFQREASPGGISQPQRSPSQQQAASQNQTARQGMASRGGLMGMLGGLALGGLLGSLFFGGAFENFNIMDFLLFAGIAYLAYRLFAAKATRPAADLGNAYSRQAYQETSVQQAATAGGGFDTDVMFRKSQHVAASIPANFDQPAFLAGAEKAFRYLQVCWDNRDLAGLRGLTTDKVFVEIQGQLTAAGNVQNKTEVLKIDAELLSVRESGAILEAAVLFDTLIREDEGQAERVQEVWHFIKPISSQQSKWFLDGIQQVAE